MLRIGSVCASPSRRLRCVVVSAAMARLGSGQGTRTTASGTAPPSHSAIRAARRVCLSWRPKLCATGVFSALPAPRPLEPRPSRRPRPRPSRPQHRLSRASSSEAPSLSNSVSSGSSMAAPAPGMFYLRLSLMPEAEVVQEKRGLATCEAGKLEVESPGQRTSTRAGARRRNAPRPDTRQRHGWQRGKAERKSSPIRNISRWRGRPATPRECPSRYAYRNPRT